MKDEEKSSLQKMLYIVTANSMNLALSITISTCIELKIVKSQANTAVFLLIANSPNTQVSPSRGSRIRDALTTDLYVGGWKV